MQRRAYATIRKSWPEVDVVCASEDLGFDEYLKSIRDDKLVIDMLTGTCSGSLSTRPAGSP
jgi:hypothetical protein